MSDAFCARQIAIKAGHEFIVSVDPKYANACDDKVIFMDYVSRTTPRDATRL